MSYFSTVVADFTGEVGTPSSWVGIRLLSRAHNQWWCTPPLKRATSWVLRDGTYLIDFLLHLLPKSQTCSRIHHLKLSVRQSYLSIDYLELDCWGSQFAIVIEGEMARVHDFFWMSVVAVSHVISVCWSMLTYSVIIFWVASVLPSCSHAEWLTSHYEWQFGVWRLWAQDKCNTIMI